MKYCVLVQSDYECIVSYKNKQELKKKLTDYIEGITGVDRLPKNWYEGEIEINNDDGQFWLFYWSELPLI